MVVGDQDGAELGGVGGDEQIVEGDRGAGAFQVCS